MNYTTLLERPDLFDKTLQIIEKSFDYSDDNSFSTDFSPLVMKENWNNCHLLLIEDEVVGHIGVLNKKISIEGKSFNIAMYGGIAIDEKHRGKGYFSLFFKDVLVKHNQDIALHMLWSDQTELYEKFNFHPCVDQYEYNQDLEDAEQYLPTKLNTLTDKEIKSLQLIYDNQPELRFERSFDQWCDLKEITSTDLYLKRDETNVIINYFFINKGEDLNGVVIEVGDFNDFSEIINYGVLWSPHLFEEDSESLYATMIKPGTYSLFQEFVTSYTENKIMISSIKEDTIDFSFEESKLQLTTNDFLTGIFGPNSFEELNTLKPLYISGLDSI